TGAGGIRLCNTGAVVPIAGSATLQVNPNGQTGFVEIDGDTANSSQNACLDGHARIGVGSGGPTFYESKDGSNADTRPNQAGNQPAAPEAPEVWLQNIVANCAGPLPDPPAGAQR
ncbi:MAG: hypothetical protein ACRDH5_07330, partial [bacterium]